MLSQPVHGFPSLPYPLAAMLSMSASKPVSIEHVTMIVKSLPPRGFSVNMFTIIHFVIIVQMIVFAARIPASAPPSLLHNSQHQLDNQPHTDIHHDLTASPHPLEVYSGVGLASRKDIRSPNADNQEYVNCVLQDEGFGQLPE